MRTPIHLVLAVLTTFAVTERAEAGDKRSTAAQLFLHQAVVSYQGLDFEKCIKRLQKAENLEKTESERAQIQLYLGLCHASLGLNEIAQKHFAATRLLDPSLGLPPGTSPKIRELFSEADGPVNTVPQQEAVTDAPVVEAPTQPHLSVVPTEPTTPARATAEAAPGRSGKSLVLPITLGGVGLVGVGVGAILGSQALNAQNQARSAQFDSEMVALNRQAVENATAANVSYAVAGACVVGAVVTYFLLK